MGYQRTIFDTIKKMNELGKNYHLRTQDGGRSTIIEDDPVDSPSHYKGGRVEVIDFLEDYVPDFRLANVVKYIARAGVKDPNKFEQDIKKAQWYLNRYIEKEFNDADSGNESKS